MVNRPKDGYTFAPPLLNLSNKQKTRESPNKLEIKPSQVIESNTVRELLIPSELGGTLCMKVEVDMVVGYVKSKVGIDLKNTVRVPII